MDKNFEILLHKFQEIKKKGYIKSNSNRKTNSGIVFEKFVNSTGGDFSIPDFKDIELKVISCGDKVNINLFNSGPDGKYICATQWLAENYGYPDKDYKQFNVLKADVFANKYNKIGLKHYFKLAIDKINQKVTLEIYNLNYKLLNNDIYWDFDSLKSRLSHKLKKLAIISVKYLYVNNSYNYYFNEIKFYKFRSFDKFIEALSDGFIAIKINTGIHKSGYKKGQFHDHGTTFKVVSTDIEKIFERIY